MKKRLVRAIASVIVVAILPGSPVVAVAQTQVRTESMSLVFGPAGSSSGSAKPME